MDATAYCPIQLAKFFAAYSQNLAACMAETPEKYATAVLARGPAALAEAVLNRIHSDGIRGLALTGAPAMTRTCKVLGLPLTYKAIESFLTKVEG